MSMTLENKSSILIIFLHLIKIVLGNRKYSFLRMMEGMENQIYQTKFNFTQITVILMRLRSSQVDKQIYQISWYKLKLSSNIPLTHPKIITQLFCIRIVLKWIFKIQILSTIMISVSNKTDKYLQAMVEG